MPRVSCREVRKGKSRLPQAGAGGGGCAGCMPRAGAGRATYRSENRYTEVECGGAAPRKGRGKVQGGGICDWSSGGNKVSH